MSGGEASTSTGVQQVRKMAISVEHPFLHRLEPESIRVFLRKYDAYCRELKSRAAQLSFESSFPMEPARPVGLTFCVDAEQLESAVECGMITGVTDVELLTDETLRAHLERKAQQSTTVVTQDDLASLVETQLRMDMKIKSATGRMELLFMDYKSLLRTNGLKWVTTDTPKVAIKHVISAIRPTTLGTRIEQDLGFSHARLKADFSGFMAHAISLSEAFERLDCGHPKTRKSDKDNQNVKKDSNIGKTGFSSRKAEPSADSKSEKNNKRAPPGPCPLPSCKGKNLIHWAKDCTKSTEAEKKKISGRSRGAQGSGRPGFLDKSKVFRGKQVSQACPSDSERFKQRSIMPHDRKGQSSFNGPYRTMR